MEYLCKVNVCVNAGETGMLSNTTHMTPKARFYSLSKEGWSVKRNTKEIDPRSRLISTSHKFVRPNISYFRIIQMKVM